MYIALVPYDYNKFYLEQGVARRVTENDSVPVLDTLDGSVNIASYWDLYHILSNGVKIKNLSLNGYDMKLEPMRGTNVSARANSGFNNSKVLNVAVKHSKLILTPVVSGKSCVVSDTDEGIMLNETRIVRSDVRPYFLYAFVQGDIVFVRLKMIRSKMSGFAVLILFSLSGELLLCVETGRHQGFSHTGEYYDELGITSVSFR